MQHVLNSRHQTPDTKNFNIEMSSVVPAVVKILLKKLNKLKKRCVNKFHCVVELS